MDKRSNRTRTMVLVATLTLPGVVSACEDEPPPQTQSGLPTLGVNTNPQGPSAAPVGTSQATAKPLSPVSYSDDDFLESERNRDPFRAQMTTADRTQVAAVSQRRVVMPNTSIEAMRLVAIITGTDRPRAMILDPQDVGHVVERGMFIGTPQVVQASGNVAMTLNWRVDRIRENEVVLSRQDPTDPTRAPLTRVMPLHEEIAQR